MSRVVFAGLALILVGTTFAEGSERRALAFQDRAKAQRAIEEIYWRHRIWPKENPTPKPPLAAVQSDDAIRTSVDDYLKKSAMLEKTWRRPVTQEQLQAELDRIAKGTRDPQSLKEIFHALGDDPYVIAETLARPTLVDRLIRSWYAYDDRFHGDVRRRAESARAHARAIDEMRSMGGDYHELTYRLQSSPPSPLSLSSPERGDVREVSPEDWGRMTRELIAGSGSTHDAIPVGSLSDVQEAADQFFVTALLSRNDREVRIASVAWPKRSFDAWWTEQSSAIEATIPNVGSEYTLTVAPTTACTDDVWERSYYSPEARTQHMAIWTGAEMIIWGGYRGGNALNSGARYNPTTDVWTQMGTGGSVPTVRSNSSAVWTGSEMIVWGGDSNGYGLLNTGGRYNPSADTWIPTSTASPVPSARSSAGTVWTGTEMIVWGGFGATGILNTGGRYNPSSNSWQATSTSGSLPEARGRPTAVWTGTEMIVWGGSIGTYVKTGGRYNPSSDTWIATSTGANTPSARDGHSAIWTGTKMIIWGGTDNSSVYVSTGAVYNPVTNAWTPTRDDSFTASGRGGHAAVWTGTEMLIWGGYGGGLLNTGARYTPTSDSWTAMSMVGAPSPRSGPTGVWTGSELIVWGGGASAEVGTGGRYSPATDSWAPTPPGATISVPRSGHASVWTGTELIVWGGYVALSPYYPQTGGRYTPAIDTWTLTGAGPNVPAARSTSESVWTGTEMIVWGGNGANGGAVNTGGRYNPTSNTWVATSLDVNVPSPRVSNTAVWTGTRMIVWGGSSPANLNTGGQYDPAANSWSPTAVGTDTPSGRYGHSGIWTGERLLIWGGQTDSGALNNGAAYDPSANVWTPSSAVASAPSARAFQTTVWTGTEMIVWGGINGSTYLNTGGRYNPASDAWSATSTAVGVPVPQIRATGVWTGKEMIVWGGYNGSSLYGGGRYDPSSEIWRPTSVTAVTPQGRSRPSVVWTGTQMVIWGGSILDTSMYRYCGFVCTGVPEKTPGLVLAKAPSGSAITLAWAAVPGATAYDIVRGSLTDLRLSGGDFSSATQSCVADDFAATSLVDDGVDNEWYLVRVVACGAPASYDSGPPNQSQPRDAEIAASGQACP